MVRISLDTVYCMDCAEGLSGLQDESVDVILTDPPYIGDLFEKAYQTLADHAARVLKPSGFLVTYAGQYHLDKTMQILSGVELNWFWLVCQENGGPSTYIHPRNILARFKPILIYQKSPTSKSPRMLTDRIRGRRSKVNHPWEQYIGDSLHILRALAKPGMTIVDPFCGSGTALLAAKLLGMHWVGFEISQEYCEVSRRRLTQKPLDIQTWEPSKALVEVI